MPEDLRALMERSVAQPPAEPHRVDHVVRRAERARRRYRGVQVAAGALAVVLVVAAGSAAVRLQERLDDRVPAPQVGVVGPQLRLADATPAVAGRDYERFASYAAHDLENGNDLGYDQVTRGGDVLVSDPRLHDPGDAVSEYDRYGLLSPGSARVRWLPEPPDVTYPSSDSPGSSVVSAVSDTAVLWLTSKTETNSAVEVYHRDTGTWTTLGSTRALGLGYGSLALAAGRVWYGGAGSDRSGPLRSVPDDGSGAPRDEGRVGDWAVDDDHLVWTSAHNARSDTYAVRDLATGEQQTFPTRSGRRCNQLGISLAAQRVALEEFCGEKGRVRDDRVHVVSLDGRQVVTARGSGVDRGVLGADFLALVAEDDAGTDGTYVYDFRDARLRRVSTGASHYAASLGAGGSTFFWATPYRGGRGQDLYAATWTAG